MSRSSACECSSKSGVGDASTCVDGAGDATCVCRELTTFAAELSKKARTALRRYQAHCITQTAAFLYSLECAKPQYDTATTAMTTVAVEGEAATATAAAQVAAEHAKSLETRASAQTACEGSACGAVFDSSSGGNNVSSVGGGVVDGDGDVCSLPPCVEAVHDHAADHYTGNLDSTRDASDTLLTLLSDVGDTDDDGGVNEDVYCGAYHKNDNDERGCSSSSGDGGGYGHDRRSSSEAGAGAPVVAGEHCCTGDVVPVMNDTQQVQSSPLQCRRQQPPPHQQQQQQTTQPQAPRRRCRKERWQSRMLTDLQLNCSAEMRALSMAPVQSPLFGSLPALCGGMFAVGDGVAGGTDRGYRDVVLECDNTLIACGRVSRVYLARLRVVPYDASLPSSEDNFDMSVAVKVWYVSYAHIGGTRYFQARLRNLVRVSHRAIVRYFAFGIAPLTSTNTRASVSSTAMTFAAAAPECTHARLASTTAATAAAAAASSSSSASLSSSTLTLPSMVTGAGLASLRCAIVMEYANGGSLDVLVKRSMSGLCEDDVRGVLRDILPALCYMHDTVGYVHNDVKPHNILLFCDKETDDDDSNTTGHTKLPPPPPQQQQQHKGEHASSSSRRYKLVDFASAAVAQSPAETLAQLRQPREQLLKQSALLTVFTGTAAFMSPESCLGVTRHTGNDVWSLGITTFYLATGRAPWYTLETSNPELILHGYRARFATGYLFTELRGDEDGGEGVTRAAAAATATSTTHTAAAATPPAAHDEAARRAEQRDADNVGSCGRRSRRASESSSSSGDSRASKSSDCVCRTFGPITDELDDDRYSRELKDFVRLCLIENPLQRPTCAQLMRHAFITGDRLA